MGFLMPQTPTVVPVPTPAQAAPAAQSPEGARPGVKASTPSFLGAGVLPQDPANAGGKTLLGQ